MKILAIDPGTTQSAYVIYDSDDKTIDESGIVENLKLSKLIPKLRGEAHLVIEMIKSYGNVMGDSILGTCTWIGRFNEAWGDEDISFIPRKKVVTNLCMNPRANDSNVRQAIIDLYGGKGKAIGNAKAPGPLYKIKKDMWSALGLAIVCAEAFEYAFLD